MCTESPAQQSSTFFPQLDLPYGECRPGPCQRFIRDSKIEIQMEWDVEFVEQKY